VLDKTIDESLMNQWVSVCVLRILIRQNKDTALLQPYRANIRYSVIKISGRPVVWHCLRRLRWRLEEDVNENRFWRWEINCPWRRYTIMTEFYISCVDRTFLFNTEVRSSVRRHVMNQPTIWSSHLIWNVTWVLLILSIGIKSNGCVRRVGKDLLGFQLSFLW
jgi:hypothetical protein